MDKTAVLLLQMGGPDSLDAVRPFLLRLFSDRDIIRLGPAFFQPLIARFIACRRSETVRESYRKIGGFSPLRRLTELQAAELEKRLGRAFRCFVAMRYWKPDTTDTLKAIRHEGIDHIVALPLYPHYCRATSGSSFNELARTLNRLSASFCMTYVKQFFSHPLYIAALVEKIEKALAGFSDRTGVRLLFSAHSVPCSLIDAGDPYLDQIRVTVAMVMESFQNVDYHLAFQSRAGPIRWLEPSTEEVITELARKGTRALLVIPVSFVSDHMETLYEIDIAYREMALNKGINDFRRMESLNDSPLFIRCLAELVREAR